MDYTWGRKWEASARFCQVHQVRRSEGSAMTYFRMKWLQVVVRTNRTRGHTQSSRTGSWNCHIIYHNYISDWPLTNILVILGIIYNQLTEGIFICSMEHLLRITAGHLVTYHIVLLPLWKDWQFIQIRIGSFPWISFFLFQEWSSFCLSFFFYLQGLNQLIVSGLTKFLLY